MIKIAAFADTHGNHNSVKFKPEHLEADLLVFGGDFSHPRFSPKDFLNWFSNQPNKYKVLISGNMDYYADDNREEFKKMIPDNIIYLENESTIIEGFKIFGSPNTTLAMHAFGKSESELEAIYDEIHEDTDLVITHTPPFGILDTSSKGFKAGSKSLSERLKELPSVKLNIFGHVHHSSGVLKWSDDEIYANVSVFNGEEPYLFELKK